MLPAGLPVSFDTAWLFFTHDILPHPLRTAEQLDAQVWWATWDWFRTLFIEQALPELPIPCY